MRRTLAALILLCAGGLPGAGAQTGMDAPPNLAGLWSFEADLNTVCTFTGQARLIPTRDPLRFDCEMTAEQVCRSVDVHYVVEQSCEVEIADDTVTVFSTVQSFLRGEPTANYLPDNFQLLIRDESSLDGYLIGTGGYPARWRRAEGAIS